MIDFEKAKQTALATALSWLPDGDIIGDEWVGLNPTRNDNHAGSFRVNIKTGKWSEFSESIGGGDLVSCYAYLNHSSLSIAALDVGYADLEKGIQTEAAKEILGAFSGGTDQPATKPVTTKPSYWDAFRQITTGLRSEVDPTDNLMYMQKFFGEYKKHWTFTDKKGHVMFLVARFYKDGKKSDLPFSPFSDGQQIKWRAKNLEGVKLPLYNLVGIDKNQNLPILMTEGQKNAEDARELLSSDFVTTTVFQSPDKTDLEPLRGREVFYWFDADSAGRKKLKKVKELLEAMDVIFHAVHSPSGKAQGWDISDAIAEGWSKEQIIAQIKPSEEVALEDQFLDDGFKMPFKIVGQNADFIYFLPKETCILLKFKRTQLGKASLVNLMDTKNWGASFPAPQGGVAWDIATNWLIRASRSAPIFSDDMIRRSGAWIDDGKVVIHAGDRLLINRKEYGLFDADTRYIYEKHNTLPYRYDKPLVCAESSKLFDILDFVDVERPEQRLYLAGWMMLAPFGGSLTWRPSVWITGAKGAGKSHILNNIVFPLITTFGIRALGASTPAGFRQKLSRGSSPIMVDEAEGDTQKKKETLIEVLNIVRQASSGGENTADILQGTTDQGGSSLNIQSMFLFASIGASLSHSADASRMAMIQLATPRKDQAVSRHARFEKMLQAEKTITKEWALAFHARTLNLLPEVVKCVDVFRERTMLNLGTNRQGDQYGSLLGGAWMISHDKAPTVEECDAYLKSLNLSSEDVSTQDDEQVCLEYILSYKLEIDRVKKSVGMWLLSWFDIQPVDKLAPTVDIGDMQVNAGLVKEALEDSGIKPVVSRGDRLAKILIAVDHPRIKTMLRDTPWDANYSDMLSRLEYCKKGCGSSAFGALGRKSYRELDAKQVFGEDVPF